MRFMRKRMMQERVKDQPKAAQMPAIWLPSWTQWCWIQPMWGTVLPSREAMVELAFEHHVSLSDLYFVFEKVERERERESVCVCV
jgi:hypothetical protein